jgi:hypothetical protein
LVSVHQYVIEPVKVTVWISPDSATGSSAQLEISP